MALPGPPSHPSRLRALLANPGHAKARAGVKAAPVAPQMPRWALVFPPPEVPAPFGDGEADEAAREKRAERIAAAERLVIEAKAQQRDAAAAWRQVVPDLDALGLLSRLDAALLCDYCVCWAQLRMCLRTLSRDGMAVQGERGWQKHPCLTAATALRVQLKAYIAELGLGPSSRGRLQLPEGGDGAQGSPWDV